MSLSAGDKLGPYEILEQIGAGGMGEVYRARDTRLGRSVAVKVSAELFSERFEREARVIASLNHPNICALYDVGPNYLVMELVEGESPKGPLPLDETVRIASQIADALAEAHEKGIVHRDLKPGNIKIKNDGTVKVLDFGLAKVNAAAVAQSEDSPTISMAATQAGVILGTAAYMAPEQARGKPVDKRADIWAFGVVVYELLVGKRLFVGETVTDTLAAVIEREPDWQKVSPHLQRLLQSCLKKDPKERLHDIADAKLLIGDQRQEVVNAVSPPSKAGLAWTVAGLCLLAALGIAFLHFRERAPAADTIRFQMSVPQESSALSLYLALSPDGRKLVVTANEPDGTNRLWVRSMDTLEARMLPGTENATSPFWSPDSRTIGFSDGGKLKKVDAAGAAPPVTLTEVQGNAGMGTWSADGVIVFGNRQTNGGLRRVPASGGTAVPLSNIDNAHQETSHSFPVFMPDGQHFIYLRAGNDPNTAGIYPGSIDMKPPDPLPQRILPSSLGVVFVATDEPAGGRLLYLRDGTLMAQPFDVKKLALVGEPVPVAEKVGSAGAGGYFTASASGALAYRTGEGQTRRLSWFDRTGKRLNEVGDAAFYDQLALSHDGTRAATHIEAGQRDVWVFDLARNSNTRLTFDPSSDDYPVWSPDGSQIAYCSGGGNSTIQRKAANGTGEPEVLIQNKSTACPQDWSRDGKYLLYATLGGGAGGTDLWVLPLNGTERKPFPFLATPFTEAQGQFSPDGKWIAYVSNESGRTELYVRPFTPRVETGGKWMVSNAGAYQPHWNRSGKELLYLNPTNKVMSVEVDGSGASFKAGIPKPLFDLPIYPAAGFTTMTPYWDLSPDGQRILAINQPVISGPAPVTVVTNWLATIKK